MKCKHVQNHLTAYLDGEVDDVLKKKIEAHLKICEKCITQTKLHQQTWEWLGEEIDFQPNPFLATKIRKRIDELEGRRIKWPIWLRHWERIFVPATAIVGLVLGIFLGGQLRTEMFASNSDANAATEIIDSSVEVLSDLPDGSFTAAYQEIDLLGNDS